MKWKTFGYDVVKGLLSGVMVAVSGMTFANISLLDSHGLKIVAGSLIGGAIHGGASLVEQYLKG